VQPDHAEWTGLNAGSAADTLRLIDDNYISLRIARDGVSGADLRTWWIGALAARHGFIDRWFRPYYPEPRFLRV